MSSYAKAMRWPTFSMIHIHTSMHLDLLTNLFQVFSIPVTMFLVSRVTAKPGSSLGQNSPHHVPKCAFLVPCRQPLRDHAVARAYTFRVLHVSNLISNVSTGIKPTHNNIFTHVRQKTAALICPPRGARRRRTFLPATHLALPLAQTWYKCTQTRISACGQSFTHSFSLGIHHCLYCKANVAFKFAPCSLVHLHYDFNPNSST